MWVLKIQSFGTFALSASPNSLVSGYPRTYNKGYNLHCLCLLWQVRISVLNMLDVDECALRYFFFPLTKPSREKLIDQYLGIKSDDPALDGTYLG